MRLQIELEFEILMKCLKQKVKFEYRASSVLFSKIALVFTKSSDFMFEGNGIKVS